MNENIILLADSYKYSHFCQYPDNVKGVYSYIEARGTDYPDMKKTLFFGLQAFILEYLTKPISRSDIDEAEEIITAHGLPFNRSGWEYILYEYDGILPLIIKALPEGSAVPHKTVMVTIENTDSNVPWLTSFIETALLRAVWYPTTVATISRYTKEMLLDYAKKCGTDPSEVDFKLHDFGSRGVSSEESAMLGGMAHLVNFKGTDTVSALIGARRYYKAKMPGFSIPAAEHSTITSWGRNREKDAFSNMIDRFGGPGKMFAAPIDSYSTRNAVDCIGAELLTKIENSHSTFVLRPDSGDPTEVPIAVIERLFSLVGEKWNDKNFSVLPSGFRVIQGDGINYKSIKKILYNMENAGIALDNIAFGMGGALLQKVDRDTFRFAMKTSSVTVQETGGKSVYRDVFKAPDTDVDKMSKRGRFMVVPHEDSLITKPESLDLYDEDQLRIVYKDGYILNKTTFDEIRSLADSQVW